MKLDGVLQKFPAMRLERPPELWEADTDEARLVVLLEAMIAAMSGRGPLTLNVNNVIVDLSQDGEDAGTSSVPEGEFVAFSVIGAAAASPPAGIEVRLIAGGARYAYVQSRHGRDSITMFIDRCTP